MDIANVRQKTQEFIDKLKDPDTRLKLETIAVHVEKIILKYFYDKQKHEVKEKKRYGKETETGRIIYPRFFDTQEEKKGKHIMEALYNMMGAVRMEYFDYNKEENKATLNQK